MPHQELNPINEIFQSIQGEGYFTGQPAIFIRLQGCDVGCSWCDTRHTSVSYTQLPTLLGGDVFFRTREFFSILTI